MITTEEYLINIENDDEEYLTGYTQDDDTIDIYRGHDEWVENISYQEMITKYEIVERRGYPSDYILSNITEE